MGEENPQAEEAKEVKKDEEKKGEEKKEETNPEIVLKVDMHCEACARKVARALKGFEGVEEVSADSRASKVVVKGKAADPAKVCERLQKKSGRKVELISPLPTPPPAAAEEKKEEPKQEQKLKDEPPTPITVVLKIRMHCEACAQGLQKRIRKIKGVKSVETDVVNDLVTVTGILEETKFVNDVFKRTRKQAIIIPNEEKKAEKEEEKKDESDKGEEKREGGNGDETVANPNDQTSTDVKRSEYWPSKVYSEYAFAYPPQMFSDENPHACSLM